VGAVVTYSGNIDIQITGSSSQENVSTAVGSASIQVRGTIPDPGIIGPPPNMSLEANVEVPAGIRCDLSSGSYVRQAGTLTVTATGTCSVVLRDYSSPTTFTTAVVNAHYATLQVTGSTALAGDGQVPAVPNPFSDTWVETDFHA
jgi:hypothetical protein